MYTTVCTRMTLAMLRPKKNMCVSSDMPKINQGAVCETLWYAPSGNKVEKAIFSFKVTRSLTLVSHFKGHK